MRLARIIGVVTAVAFVAGAAACSAKQPQPEAIAETHNNHPSFSPEPPAPLREGEKFLELAMEKPYTPAPPSGGTDEYRCFLVDPKLTERAFITGSQFLPQNADIVHHAIFFRVMPADVAQARDLDAAAPGDGWTCFGGTGIGSGDKRFRQLNSGAAWIAAWAPGGKESVIGAKSGYEMEAGSQIVMQVHYNTLGFKGKPVSADRSAIRLRVMGGSAGLSPLRTTLLPGPVELPCAAGESGPLCDREKAVWDIWSRFGEPAAATVAGLNLLCGNGKPEAGPVQKCDHKFRDRGTVYATAGHMHLLGRSIKIELNPGTPEAKVLLDVPVYDFDDQGARPLAEPVKVNQGDTLRVTCTHDATLRKQLPALKTLEPRYVVWGDGTSDEMCLGIVTWIK